MLLNLIKHEKVLKFTSGEYVSYTLTIHFSTDIVLQYALQQGQPPFLLNIQHGGRASHGGRSPVNESSDKRSLIELKCMTTLCHGKLYQKKMKQAFGKKGAPREGYLVQNVYIFSTRLKRQVDA